MKITAGKRGDAAREAKDKAENKYYWDNYNRAKMLPKVKEEYQGRRNNAIADIRRQIDRLIPDGYAKQIFEDDVYVTVQVGDGNRTYAKVDEVKEGSSYRSRNNPEQINVVVGNKYGPNGKNSPFRWEWRAKFDYEWNRKDATKEGTYVLKNDISSYNFDSTDPQDIEYFAACATIFKALSKLNWSKVLSTNPFEGMEDMLIELPDRPERRDFEEGGRYDRKIRLADIEDAIEEWKKGDKWLYVGIPNSYHKDRPGYDSVATDNLQDGPGYYRYLGESDKFYRVEYMSRSAGKHKLEQGEPAQKDNWQYKDKVKKDAFEASVYWPITWWGKAAE